jgi:hypothetical protein
MGRYNFRVRPIYGENEPTFGEQLSGGIKLGLDLYEGRREAQRQEQNEVLSRGGTRAPDAAPDGIEGAVQRGVRGIGRGIGGLIRRIPGVGDRLEGPQPTGTFVENSRNVGYQPGLLDTTTMGRDQVNGGIADALGAFEGATDLRRVVPRAAPVGALPPETTRGTLAPTLAAPNGLPQLQAASPERTFEYQGVGNRRYQMPQVGERERTNRMLEYETKAQFDTRVDQERQRREADLYTRARENPDNPQAEGEFRAATKMWPYEEEFGRQQRANSSMTFEQRKELEELKAKLKAGTASNSDKARLRSIQEGNLALARQREERLNRGQAISAEATAGRLDATAAATEQRAVVTDPLDRRMLERNPRAKAENDARQARVDQALRRSAQTANRVRNRVADRATVASRAQALQKMGLPREKIREQLQAEGYPVQ